MDLLKDILARWQMIRLKHLLQAANQNQSHNVLLYAEIDACKEFLDFLGRGKECDEVVRKYPIVV